MLETSYQLTPGHHCGSISPHDNYDIYMVLFYNCIYGCMLYMLLFNFVLCIFIVIFMYFYCYVRNVLYILFS